MKLVSTALLLLAGLALNAQEIAWYRTYEGGNPVYMVTDQEGNVYLSGYYSGSTNVMGTVIASDGLYTCYVAKIDENANVLWIDNFETTGSCYITGIALNANQEPVICGSSYGLTQFYGYSLGSDADLYDRPFVITLNAAGEVTGLATINASTSLYFYGLSVQENGNILVAGTGFGDFSFAGEDFDNAGGSDAFYGAFDSDLNKLWMHSFGGSGYEYAHNIIESPDGSLAVTGSFENSFFYDGFEFDSEGGTDVFVARTDAAGNMDWVTTLGSSDYDALTNVEVAADENSHIYIAFTAPASVSYPGGTLTTYGQSDAAVFQLEPLSGLVQWARNAGGSNYDYLNRLIMGRNNNLYISGIFGTGAAEIDGLQLYTESIYSGFIAELNTDGYANMVYQTTGSDIETIDFIDLNHKNNLIVYGAFRSEIGFNDTVEVVTGNLNYYLHAFELITAYATDIEVTAGEAQPLLTAYPNPASENVLMNGDWNTLKWLQVYDMNGILILSLPTDTYGMNQVSLNLSSLPQGTYLVRAFNSEQEAISDTRIEVIR